MKSIGCPIASSYITLLCATVGESIVHDRHRSHLHELTERAEVDAYGRTQVLLRAFLALEIMATRGIASLSPVDAGSVSRLRWDRSASGIAFLLKVVRAEKEEAIASNSEAVMLDMGRNADQISIHKQRKYADALEHVEDAAVLLRQSLKNTSTWKTLGVMGKHLWTSVTLLGVVARVGIAEELLELTAEADRRAWEPRIQSLR